MAPPEDSPADILARKLRALRKSANLTQDDVAKRLNRSRITVSDWERGERLPTADDIKRYEELFKLTPGPLLNLFLKADEAVTISRRRAARDDAAADADPEPVSHPRPRLRRLPRSRRGRFAALTAAVVALALAVLLVSTSLFGGGDAGDQRRAVAPADAARRPPARVLVTIDVGATMRNDLNANDPRDGTRINAATAFVASRLQTLTKADRIGVWLMTSSPEKLKHCQPVGRTHCVLQPLVAATEPVKARLQRRIRAVVATAGRTPFYETTELGVRELRRDRDRQHGSPQAINSQVVVSAGLENAPRGIANARTVLAAAADGTFADRTNGVQILMTTAKPGECATELKPAVLTLFAGACFETNTKTKAVTARRAIIDALRTRLQRPRGSR